MGPIVITDFRRARRKGRSVTGGVSAGLVISALVHTAAAVAVGVVFHASTRAPAPEPVEVDIAVASNVAGSPSAASSSPTTAARTSPAPRPKMRPPHVAPEVSPASPAATDDGAAPAPRFALVVGVVATRRTVSAPSTAPGGAASAADVFTEGQVDAPARLLAASPLVYPQAARQAGVELDLPIEIVVDTDGRVSAPRALGRAGFGLDEAALAAIRRYRFSPALRAGRAVRVRMRWTMQFRLG